MATTEFERAMQALASDLTGAFPAAAVWQVPSGAYVPASRSVPTKAWTSYDVTLLGPPRGPSKRWLDADVLEAGDLMGRIAANDTDGNALKFTPDVGHKITWQGEEWRIVVLEPFYSGGELIAYYEFGMKKGGE
jgi:hypothetical protein